MNSLQLFRNNCLIRASICPLILNVIVIIINYHQDEEEEDDDAEENEKYDSENEEEREQEQDGSGEEESKIPVYNNNAKNLLVMNPAQFLDVPLVPLKIMRWLNQYGMFN